MADLKVKVSAMPGATSVNDSDLLYLVQGGISKKLPFDIVKGKLTAGDVIQGTFDNSDLSSGVLSLNHGKDTEQILLFIFNPSGYSQNVSWKKQDSNVLLVDFGGSIDVGDWAYLIAYWNAGTPSAATYLETVIPIGAWNMESDDVKVVAHGLDLSKIIDVKVWINGDSSLTKSNLEGHYGQGGTAGTDFDKLSRVIMGDPNITMIRSIGCSFDTSGYSSVAVNRGHIYIKYTS